MALFTLYAIRPTPVIGVDGDSLSHSVIGSGILSTPCMHHHDGTWTCGRYIGLYDEHPDANYQVEVDGLGCWSATLIGGFGRKHLSGCITLIDHIGFL
jgi:hypothetical protein